MRGKHNNFSFESSCILHLITSRNFSKGFVADNLVCFLSTGSRTFLLNKFNSSFNGQYGVPMRKRCLPKVIL